MGQMAVQIEDRLRSAGYQTQRDAGEVQVFDPVFRVSGTELILDHYKLVEIRSLEQAWSFIEGRA